MKHQFLIMLLVLSWHELLGQYEGYIQIDETIRVISTNGINMREEPNINSKIIIKIPFNHEILITFKTKSDTTINNIKGHWLKGKYKNIEGFVFSEYLRNFTLMKANALNNEYRIQPYGLILNEELNYDPKLNWYSLYCEHYKKQFQLKNAQIDINTQDPCAPIIIISKDKTRPKFFIGTKYKLKTGTFDNELDKMNKVKDSCCNLSEDDVCHTISDQSGLIIECQKFNNKDKETTYKQIVIKKSGKRQILVSDKLYDKYIDLLFYGDLDGDSKFDLILNTYNNTGDGSQGGKYYLFLSSQADESKFVKLVAYYNWITGGCD